MKDEKFLVGIDIGTTATKVIVFLASEAADFITGEAINLTAARSWISAPR